jgi:hypothetical protein
MPKMERHGQTQPADTQANPLGEQTKRDGGGYDGLVDKSVEVSRNLRGHIPPGNLKSMTQAEQYSNPPSWPGLSGLQFNRKSGDRLITEAGDRKVEKSRHMQRTGTPKD